MSSSFPRGSILCNVHGQCCQSAENSVKKLTGGSRKMSVGREKYMQIVSKGPSCRKVYKKNFRYILWKKLPVHFALPGNRKVQYILGQIYFVQEVTLYDKLRFLSLIWPNFFSHFGRVPAGIWQQCWTLRIRILYTVFSTHMHTMYMLRCTSTSSLLYFGSSHYRATNIFPDWHKF